MIGPGSDKYKRSTKGSAGFNFGKNSLGFGFGKFGLGKKCLFRKIVSRKIRETT